MKRAFPKTLPNHLKTIKNSAIIFAITATSAIAPGAFASNMVETKLTVKISISELANADGVQKAYAKLQTKAEKFCEADTSSLYYLDETVEDCVQDLMEQFITTSNSTPLKTYHEKVAGIMTTETLAMN